MHCTVLRTSASSRSTGRTSASSSSSLDTIPPHLIRWDHVLSSVCPLCNGQRELAFANGFTTTSDFLVGADGAHSHVCPLVFPATSPSLYVNSVEISLAPGVTSLPELAPISTATAASARTPSSANPNPGQPARPRPGEGRPEGALRRLSAVAAQPHRLLRCIRARSGPSPSDMAEPTPPAWRSSATPRTS